MPIDAAISTVKAVATGAGSGNSTSRDGRNGGATPTEHTTQKASKVVGSAHRSPVEGSVHLLQAPIAGHRQPPKWLVRLVDG